MDILPKIDLSLIQQVIEDPTRNLVGFVIILAAGTIVVLILVIALLIAILGPTRHGDTRRENDAPPSGRLSARDKKASPRVRVAVVCAFAALLALAAYAGGGSSASCETCHVVEYEVVGWQQGTHRTVTCTRCHEPEPVAQFPAYVARRLTNLLSMAASDPASATATTVSDTGCLECHRNVLTEIVTGPGDSRSIAMRHSDVIDSGLRCTECHRAVGHEVLGGADSGLRGMSRCVSCHDGTTASNECETCHLQDILQSSIDQSTPYPKVELAPRETCKGCHSTASCDECHGLEMPHTRAFIEGDHARFAAFERKRVCWKCHQPYECGGNGCHLPGKEHFSQHTPNWKEEHKLSIGDPDNPRTCRGACHNHEAPFSLCRRCHPND